jgi:hypothetical protein
MCIVRGTFLALNGNTPRVSAPAISVADEMRWAPSFVAADLAAVMFDHYDVQPKATSGKPGILADGRLIS